MRKAAKKTKKKNEESTPDKPSETNFKTGEPFSIKKLEQPRDKILRAGSGRRSETKTDSKSGRYVRSRIPNGKPGDIAFDATLRAAVLYQKERTENRKSGGAVVIEHRDIRQKVREKKVGNAIVFVVDSSGSMGANRRMIETKGAILSLLIDAYQKRDRVGLVAFKGAEAEVLLPLTSSIELAKKRLEELPTGGKTPLAKGLLASYELFQNELRKNIKIKPLLVLISDGKANAGLAKANIFEEVKEIAGEIRAAGINSIVIDPESGMLSFNKAREIAAVLGGNYYKLENLTANNIVRTVEESIKN
ncbi:MAG: VWA domain-containing protein [Elusimicrobiota bacterium]